MRYVVVLLAATTIPIYLTGEPAEEQVENQPWFDERRVEAHEERAEAGLIAVLVTGAAALVGLWLARGGRPYRTGISIAVLVGLVVSASLFALAALDGGQIRHDEVRPTAAMAASPDATST